MFRLRQPLKRRRAARCAVEQLETRNLLSASLPLPPTGPVGPPIVPGVTYHGGPLLEHVQVENVYLGPAWKDGGTSHSEIGHLDGFVKFLVDSPYFDALAQYKVGHGTFAGHDLDATVAAGSTIDDADIRKVLDGEITAGNVVKPTSEQFYIVFVAPGVEVTAGDQNSVNDFFGYHDTFTSSTGEAVYYAVIPATLDAGATDGLSGFAQDTVITSHELAEGVTDPDTQTGWFQDGNDEGEIGDLANFDYGTLHGYTVQAVWSNADGQAVVPGEAGSAITAHGADISATSGEAFKGTVATFTDANLHALAADFTVSIDWGDGQTSDGAVTDNPKGGFTVSGSHTYATDGWYSVTISISDKSDDQSATTFGTASVVAAPGPVDANGVDFDVTSGQEFAGSVATFTTTDDGATADNFTATIDWGDGTTSDGTIQANDDGSFSVVGKHTYTAIGDPTGDPGVPTWGDSGDVVTVPVGEGDDWGTGHDGGHHGYSSWGPNWGWDWSGDWVFNGIPDGTGKPGGFGNQVFQVSVQIHDKANDVTVSAFSLATVAVPPSKLQVTAENVGTTVGKEVNAEVATFTDANTGLTADSFKATIDWGDGTTSIGTITAGADGGFTVAGTHTYADEGIYSITVSVTDQPNDLTETAFAVANVAPVPPKLVAQGQNISATTEKEFSGVVATFADADKEAKAGDFKATIDWGDGQTSDGVIHVGADGGFEVIGTHTYSDNGTFVPPWMDGGPVGKFHTFSFCTDGSVDYITVTITDTVDQEAATAYGTAEITTAPSGLQADGTTIEVPAGQEFTGTVATFTDADSGVTADNFKATIDWGDGHKSDGTIHTNDDGSLSVVGSHTYADSGADGKPAWFQPGSRGHKGHPGFGGGKFLITITIEDSADGTSTTTNSIAHVTPTPPAIAAKGVDFKAVAGAAFDGTVAVFTAFDPTAHVANYTASIDWGDGATSDGTVVAHEGHYQVQGSHTYAAGGTFAVTVTIGDNGGHTATAEGKAVVADSAPPSNLGPVATVFTQNAEYYGQIITDFYQEFLNRTPGQKEVARWVGAMLGGATDEQVASGFIASNEFFRHAGGTNKGWVNTLYQALLGRSADAAGANAWTNALANGASRNSVAVGFATSREHRSLVIRQDYRELLGRAAHAAEVNRWVAAFQSGATHEQIVAGFLASKEYFNKHNGNARDWLFSAYANSLSRRPDAKGLAGWLSVLHGES